MSLQRIKTAINSLRELRAGVWTGNEGIEAVADSLEIAWSELRDAIVELQDSADDTGCTDDLTVVRRSMLDRLTQLLDGDTPPSTLEDFAEDEDLE